jgi:ABC-2 type transport system permease protein
MSFPSTSCSSGWWASLSPACLRKPLAFLWRDTLIAASYRFAFISQIAGIFFSVATFYFMARLFGVAVAPHLTPYAGDYFAFVLIGVALGMYLQVCLQSFSSTIRDAQVLGTLEAVLLTPTEITTIILSSGLYGFVFTSFRVAVFGLFGVALFGLNLGHANLPAALLVLALMVVAFSSLGVISASFVMVMKVGNPLNWLFSNLSWVVGGVFYPVAVLPDWLQPIAWLLPLTYALEAMRLALLKGHGVVMLAPMLIPLAAFAAITLPLSVLAFTHAVRRAKRVGSLAHF